MDDSTSFSAAYGGNAAPREAVSTTPSRLDNRIASYIFFVAIGGAPLPFGSRDAVVVAAWCGLLGLGLVFASTRHLRPAHKLFLAGVGLIVLGYLFVLHEQLAEHPWIAQPHPAWNEAAELLGIPVKPFVSVVRGEPFFALAAPAAALLALTLGVVVAADRYRARQAVWVVACSGLVYSLYGIGALILQPNILLWREKTAYIGDLTGTFVNRNTAAAYFGACATVWLALLLRGVQRRSRGGPLWRDLAGLLMHGSRAILVRVACLCSCLLALLLTNSRAGVIISLFAMVVSLGLFEYAQRRDRLIPALLTAGLAALVILQLFGGGVSGRFGLHGVGGEGRLATWSRTLRMIADHPWFGIGLGAFAWGFPAYRSVETAMWGVWDRAHSTPLELAAELGIPLAGAVIFGCLVILAILAYGVHARQRDRIIPLAAFATMLIACLHSCIDFSLQVTGFAIVAFGMAGCGIGIAGGPEPKPREPYLPR